MSEDKTKRAERDSGTVTALVRIPVLLWAEIGDQRIEETREITLQIGRGWCPKLAAERSIEPMAKLMADMEIKTGYVICDANAAGQGRREATYPEPAGSAEDCP